MAEPRLPEPMTPERADLLVQRWRLAMVLSAVAGLVLLWADSPFAVLAWLFALTVCLRSYAANRGWLDGYRAGRSEALRQDAGRQRSGEPW